MPNGKNSSKPIFKTFFSIYFSAVKFQHTNHLQSIDIYGSSDDPSFRI